MLRLKISTEIFKEELLLKYLGMSSEITLDNQKGM